MDSRAQAFAEESIRALGRADVAHARTAIAQAFELDQGLGPLADVIYLACSNIEDEGEVVTATWNTLADAVADGPLLAVVEDSRTV